MTDLYTRLNPEKTTKKVSEALATQLLTFSIAVKQEPDRRSASKTAVDWNKRLPRTFPEVLSMPYVHLDRAGFLESTAAEIRRLLCRRLSSSRSIIPTANFTSTRAVLCLVVTIGMTNMLTRRTLVGYV